MRTFARFMIGAAFLALASFALAGLPPIAERIPPSGQPCVSGKSCWQKNLVISGALTFVDGGTLGTASAGTRGSATAGFSVNSSAPAQTFVDSVTTTWRALQDSAGSDTHTQTLWTVPAKTKIVRLVSQVTQGFGGAGSTLTDVAIECGKAGSTAAYLDSASAFATPGTAASHTFDSDNIGQLKVTAKTAGSAGNSIRFRVINNNLSCPPTVNVSGNDITVSTKSTVSACSNISDVITAVQGNSSANALVNVEQLVQDDLITNTGSLTNLENGIDGTDGTGVYGDADSELGPSLQGLQGDIPSWSSTAAVQCKFTTTCSAGCNVNKLDAGSVTTWIEGMVYP